VAAPPRSFVRVRHLKPPAKSDFAHHNLRFHTHPGTDPRHPASDLRADAMLSLIRPTARVVPAVVRAISTAKVGFAGVAGGRRNFMLSSTLARNASRGAAGCCFPLHAHADAVNPGPGPCGRKPKAENAGFKIAAVQRVPFRWHLQGADRADMMSKVQAPAAQGAAPAATGKAAAGQCVTGAQETAYFTDKSQQSKSGVRQEGTLQSLFF